MSDWSTFATVSGTAAAGLTGLLVALGAHPGSSKPRRYVDALGAAAAGPPEQVARWTSSVSDVSCSARS
jgi:hypothetical protein